MMDVDVVSLITLPEEGEYSNNVLHMDLPHLTPAPTACVDYNADDHLTLSLPLVKFKQLVSVYARYGVDGKKAQELELERLKPIQDRSDSELRDDLYKVVTAKWHPLYLALIQRRTSQSQLKLQYEEFLQVCEQHAPLELVAACSQEIQDSLILVTTRKGIQCPKHADYSDVARTIAYIVATSASSNKDVDPVLSLQVDLMCRRQRCAIHLARLLQGVNEHIITATTNETQPGLSDKEKKVAKQTSSLSDIKLPSIETLEPLVEAGLTMDILEAVALYCGIDKAGQLETIALEVENLNINRSSLLNDIGPSKRSLKALVSLHWHPWHQVMLHNSVTSYDQFLSICEKYANDLLALARSEEAQDALVFVVTASGTRKAVLSNHNDIATTIAYTIALHDPVYRIEGIKNDDYFQAIKSALVAKSDQAVHMVAKKVLRVDFKTKSVLDKVPSPNQQFAGNVSASKSDEPEDLMQVVQVEGIETNANTPEPIYQGVDDDDRSSGDSEEKVSYGSDVVMDTSKLPPGILFPHGLPSKAHLKCLLDAGLSSDILDDISTCCCISGAGSAKRKGKIVDAVDKLVIDRSSLQRNAKETKKAVKSLVTMCWHPWRIIMLLGVLTTYDQFLAICEEFAKDDFEQSKASMLQIQAKIVRIDGVSRVERPRYSDIPFCIAAVQALHDSACPDEDFKENSFIKNLKESLIKKQRYILHWVFWEVLKLDINKKSAAKAHAHCHPLQATERQAEQLQLPESYSVVATYANADHGVVSTNPTSVNQYCAWLLRKGDSVRKSDIRESDQEENVPSNETHTERTIMQTNRIEPAEQDHSPKAVRANTYATSQQSHHHDILCFNTSYPVFDQVVTVVETQYSHIFFMETPFKAARFLYKKCIELLDSRQDVPEAKRANARKLLQAKYGKTLREAKEVPADELAKISDRLWHNYLKLRRESKSAEGSTGSAKAMTGVKRKQDADYA